MHRLDTYPFDNPNAVKSNMNIISDEMIGDEVYGMLQRRNNGMKSVRRSEMARSRLADQITNRGNAQIYRPRRSPIPNIRKWIELKRSGCMSLVGCTEAEMAGKTACKELVYIVG